MTLGQELDDIFYNLRTRITVLENNQEMFSFREDTKNLRHEVGGLNHEVGMAACHETVVGIEATLTSQIERLEAELTERIDEVDNFDPDDLRCDFETEIEDVRDGVNHMDDRIDELEAYKCDEDEVKYIVDRKLDDRFDEAFDSVLEDIDLASLLVRVAELEARLNKPSFTARALRWLREGPSIKETATNWYAGIRRGS